MNRKLSFAAIPMIFLVLTFFRGQPNQQESQSSQTASSTRDILKRIGEVENKLTSPVMIEGAEQVFHSLAEKMEFYSVPGVSIAVINNGEIEWAKGYGLRIAGRDLPVDANTLFQAASISKSVSALGALHLVQKGRLDLDTDVNNFLESWKVPENEFTRSHPVTVRYLLCHGAGISGHSLGTYAGGDEIPTVLQLLDGKPPSKVGPIRVIAKPQTEFKYSGGGYLILLQTMIDVIGEPFPDIMDKGVLGPIGMERSVYIQPLEYGSAENVAAGHDGMGTAFEDYWQTMANLAGGGLWTTPSDLCLFAIEVQKALQGKSSIITRELAEEMLAEHMGSYGLGLMLQGEEENLAFGHGGGNRGYQNFFFAFARRGQGVAVMTNAQKGLYLYEEILRSVAIVYDWPLLKPSVVKPVQLPMEKLSSYTGRYVFNNALGTEVVIEKSHLKMVGDDGRIFLWYPDSENHFIDTITGWELEFIFDEENEVTGAVISMAGEAVIIKGEKMQI